MHVRALLHPLPPGASADHRRRRANTIAIALSVMVSATVALYVLRHVTSVRTFIERLGLVGPLVCIVLQMLFGASPIPTEPLTMLSGAVFGPVHGMVYSWIGYMLAAFVEYFLGTRIREASDFEHHRSSLPFGLGRLPASSPWFLILTRIIPGYGPKLVGIVAGIFRISLWRYAWTAAIPNALGAALFALGGFELESLR